MTLSEAQALRTVYLSALTSIASGGVAEYSISGGGAARSIRKLDPSKMMEEIAKLDTLIDRLQNGTFDVVQFRCPE